MSKVSAYHIKLAKILSTGHKNIDAFYLLLKSDRSPYKIVSKPMRIDE